MPKPKSTTRYALEEVRRPERRTGWTTFERAPSADGPADPAGFDWSNAVILEPQPKVSVSIRLDGEIVEFFKKGGKGYQTRINAVLRSYMEAQEG